MNKQAHYIEANDGTKIFTLVYQPITPPVGIVQIAHGMAEFAERYEAFALWLNNKGFVVVANDHRGHGKTAGSNEKLGFFDETLGIEKVLGDMLKVLKFTKQQHPNLPYFLLGHSMGSFFSRRFASIYTSELAGLILSGTADNPGLLGIVGKLLAKTEALLKGKKAKSPLLDTMSFGAFKKGIKDRRTDFDWLSHDPKIVDDYIESPYCGFVCSTWFYVDLLNLMLSLNRIERPGFLPTDFPVMFFAGGQDPVGKKGEGVKNVHQKYVNAGLSKLTLKIYPKGRHEMLNETNKEEVFSDVLNFLNSFK